MPVNTKFCTLADSQPLKSDWKSYVQLANELSLKSGAEHAFSYIVMDTNERIPISSLLKGDDCQVYIPIFDPFADERYPYRGGTFHTHLSMDVPCTFSSADIEHAIRDNDFEEFLSCPMQNKSRSLRLPCFKAEMKPEEIAAINTIGFRNALNYTDRYLKDFRKEITETSFPSKYVTKTVPDQWVGISVDHFLYHVKDDPNQYISFYNADTNEILFPPKFYSETEEQALRKKIPKDIPIGLLIVWNYPRERECTIPPQSLESHSRDGTNKLIKMCKKQGKATHILSLDFKNPELQHIIRNNRALKMDQYVTIFRNFERRTADIVDRCSDLKDY